MQKYIFFSIIFMISNTSLFCMIKESNYRKWVQEATYITLDVPGRKNIAHINVDQNTTIQHVKNWLYNHKLPITSGPKLAPIYRSIWTLWLLDKVGGPQPDSTNIKYLMNYYNSERFMLRLESFVGVPTAFNYERLR